MACGSLPRIGNVASIPRSGLEMAQDNEHMRTMIVTTEDIVMVSTIHVEVHCLMRYCGFVRLSAQVATSCRRELASR